MGRTISGSAVIAARATQVAARLKAVREELGLTQADAARRTRINPQTMCAHEQGAAMPLVDAGEIYATHYGVTLDYIYLGDLRCLASELAAKLRLRGNLMLRN